MPGAAGGVIFVPKIKREQALAAAEKLKEQMNDASSYRKAVLRKKNGTKWLDTNNSTNDFEAAAKPSYFEY